MDRYPASAGSEGDPVNLAVTRTANFWNRKIVEWPENAPEKAQYRCEHCSKMIDEHQKAWMLKHGELRSRTISGRKRCSTLEMEDLTVPSPSQDRRRWYPFREPRRG